MRLIDADALKEHKFVSINCYLKSNCDNGFPQYKQGWNDAIDAIIDNAPTVEQLDDTELQRAIGYSDGYLKGKEERPQGEWQLHGMIYYCSECGHECGESGDNFCGNCGADMRGENNG